MGEKGRKEKGGGIEYRGQDTLKEAVNLVFKPSHIALDISVLLCPKEDRKVCYGDSEGGGEERKLTCLDQPQNCH